MNFTKILARLCGNDKKQPQFSPVLVPMTPVGLTRVRTESALFNVFSDSDSARTTPSYRSVNSTPVTSPDLTSASATPASPELSSLDVDAARKELREIKSALGALRSNVDEMDLFGSVYLTEHRAKMRAAVLTGLAAVVGKYFPDQVDVISALRGGAQRVEESHQFTGSSLDAVIGAMVKIAPLMNEKVKFLAGLIERNAQFQPIRDAASPSPRP